jgi:hypothetical protein
MDVLLNAALAVLVFAVLYAISRAANLWSTFLARRSEASSEPDAPAQSRIRTAKFGARFH